MKYSEMQPPETGTGSEKTVQSGYEVSISPGNYARGLLIVAIILLANHVVLTIYHYRVEEISWLLRQLFDVDEENNLPTCFSGFLLFSTAIFLWFYAQDKRANRKPWFRHWYVLAIGFLLLSIDEIAGLHESINTAIEPTWAIAGGLIALALGLAFIPFLLHLPRRTALLFALAGAGYIGGAVGMEFVGEPIPADTLEYNLVTAVEEGLEMLSVILFQYTLLRYMQKPGKQTVDASLHITRA